RCNSFQENSNACQNYNDSGISVIIVLRGFPWDSARLRGPWKLYSAPRFRHTPTLADRGLRHGKFLERRAQPFALAVVKAHLARSLGHRLGFDPFRDSGDAHLAAKPGQTGQKRIVALGAADLLDHGAVEFDEVHREGMQVIDRGGAGAEIVQPDPVSHRPQRTDRLAG